MSGSGSRWTARSVQASGTAQAASQQAAARTSAGWTLAASLGTLLAWFGWRLLLAGGFAGFLLGGVFAGALLVSRRVDRKQPIPFGPFMIAGAVLAVVTWPR